MLFGRLAAVIAAPASLGCRDWSETGGVEGCAMLAHSRAAGSRSTWRDKGRGKTEE